MWNTARTPAEIAANMYKQLIGNETGLVAYYRHIEGQTVKDHSTTDPTIAPVVGVRWDVSVKGEAKSVSVTIPKPDNPSVS